METSIVFLIVVVLMFSALFSGVEIAFISADRLFIELQAKKGGSRDQILSKFKNQPEMFIATLLVGNTLVLVFYGLLMAGAMEPTITQWLTPHLKASYVELSVMGIQTIISTIIVLATAEFLPKSLFLINPYKILKVLIYPVMVTYYVLYPFVWVIVRISKFLIESLFGQDYSSGKAVFGLTDLNNYLIDIVSKSEDKDDNVEVDTKMFHNALEFQKVKLRECMIPRTELIAIEASESVEALSKMFVDTGCSKILIYKESIDDIIGYVHHSKLFKKPATIKEVISEIVIAPETMLANNLMILFTQNRKSIALVVDEYGGTAGVVTMEDVIEEIFGEIEDEYDGQDLLDQQIGENEWLLSARHEIYDLNEKYKMRIPEGDYDTLGGFILNINGDIPIMYDRIQHNEFTFIIKAMEGIKIDKVLVSINKMEEKLD